MKGRKVIQPMCVQCGVNPLPAGAFFCTVLCGHMWAMTVVPHAQRCCGFCFEWTHPDDWHDPEGGPDRCPMCECEPVK